jgi:hypothetical protein
VAGGGRGTPPEGLGADAPSPETLKKIEAAKAGAPKLAGRTKYHTVRLTEEYKTLGTVLGRLGILVDEARPTGNRSWELTVTERDIHVLKALGINPDVIQEDLESHYAKVCRDNLAALRQPAAGAAPAAAPPSDGAAPKNMTYGSMGGFYTLQEIEASLDKMRQLYPAICAAKVSIGASAEGRPIWMVKISDNVGTDEPEPEAFFDGLHHAREPGSYTAMLYAMWYLLENYGTNPECT